MRALFFLLLFLPLSACGPSDDATSPNDDGNGNNDPDFSIELSANASVMVDETVTVTITSSEPMASLMVSFDNFATGTTSYSNLGSNTLRYLGFDKPGTNTTVYFKAKNANGDESIKTYTPTVSIGNAVKITGVQVVSFYNIDGTWDPEFPNTDVNRLADVFFHLQKPQVGIATGELGFQNWFTSSVKENQGNLTWNLSSENLYINPQLPLLYSMADDDGEMNDDLMLGPPFERQITLAEHIATQPGTITLNVPEIDLEVVLTVEWH